MEDKAQYTTCQLYATAIAGGMSLESDGQLTVYEVSDEGQIVAKWEDGIALLGELRLLRADLAAAQQRIAELEAAALNLCGTLRHWHQNGDFECDSAEHQALEIVLRGTETA